MGFFEKVHRDKMAIRGDFFKLVCIPTEGDGGGCLSVPLIQAKLFLISSLLVLLTLIAMIQSYEDSISLLL